MASTEFAHTLKVTLVAIEPLIWRRVRVPSALTLRSVHEVIQRAMGWNDCHLHEFEVGGEQYGAADDELEEDVRDEGSVTLADVAPSGSRFRYTYDFGDGWEHVIEVEAVDTTGEPGPTCLAGERACPPEDCGGAPGYADLIAVLADPAHPDHEELRDWVGGAFDPEAVDVEDINRRLSTKKRPR